MTTTSVKLIQSHLDGILGFLKPHLIFVNCHMVGYLTDQLWETHIPESIRKRIQTSEDVDDAVDMFWNFHRDPNAIQSTKFDGFFQFLQQAQMHRLDSQADGIQFSVAEMRRKLNSLGFESKDSGGLQIKEFMSEKKNHEVAIAAQLIATLCGSRDGGDQKLSVIDAGDGKGYLSSRLALEHRLNILGVDASETNTAGAEKRTAQLERAWTGLSKRAEDVQNGIIPPKKGRRKREELTKLPSTTQPTLPTQDKNYQRSTHFITPATNFISLFKEHHPNVDPVGFCLSGLHTCGNLSASCLQIFRNNSSIRCLCNVGCCYHLLDEQFTKNDFFVERHSQSDHQTDDHVVGFPLSQHLKSKGFAMGRNARMLAAQSLDRTVDARELPSPSLFYRALLETLIVQQNPKMKNCIQVGRMKKIDSFSNYVSKCAKRANLNNLGSDEDLEELLVTHELNRKLMNLFYLIRMTLAPVLESVILLDRLLYLKESGFDDVFLVKLFDPVVSPRCYAVVAIK